MMQASAPAAGAARQKEKRPAGRFSFVCQMRECVYASRAAQFCGSVSANDGRCSSFTKCLSRFGWRSRQLSSGIRKSR